MFIYNLLERTERVVLWKLNLLMGFRFLEEFGSIPLKVKQDLANLLIFVLDIQTLELVLDGSCKMSILKMKRR